MNADQPPEILKLFVVSESPSCRLAGQWRKAFSRLPPGEFEIQWMFLSRPLDFLRKRNALLKTTTPVQVHTLGWFSTVLTPFWLPKTIPLIPTSLPNGNDIFLQAAIARAKAQIHFPSVPKRHPRPTMSPNAFQLVCRADMVAGSGALEALWAFTMVRLAGWQCTLWMVGEGPLLDEFQSFAKLASLPEDIRFVPNFRSEAFLPVVPDLILAPLGGGNWSGLPTLQSANDQTTTHSSQDQPQASPPILKEMIVSIAWKPHHICRAIMETLTQLKYPKSQSVQEPKRISLAKVLKSGMGGVNQPMPELPS